ncbi:MAG: formate dehydrogenase accessory sulfurtransferase FdhD [Bacteroidales bacterium]
MKTNKQITRISSQNSEVMTDQLAIEKQYELILNGKKEYTFVCSPENIDYMTIGYLYTHEKIKSTKDIQRFDRNNGKIDVALLKSTQNDKPYQDEVTFSIDIIKESMKDLNKKGLIFQATGCTHISGLLKSNNIICHFEDISRHNAIYKTLGYAIQNDIPLGKCALLLSCRITASVITLIQATPLQILCSQSAVSSLAIDKALETRKSIMGFIRQDRINLYTGHQRLI